MRNHLLSLLFFVLTPIAGLAFTPTTVPVGPSGDRATIDLPPFMHQTNTGGTDGAGLCVFTSSEVDAYGWQNQEAVHGFQKWMEKNKPGGGYPDKFEACLTEYCKSKGIPVPPYIQHVGGDEAFLELAMKTRRAACVTYAGMDDFYTEDIAHMVVLGNLGGRVDGVENTCILDNNRAGKWIWMTRDQWSYRWHLNTWGKGWAIVFLTPPPPPGEDELSPAPKPKPKPNPKPRPWRPLFPRWHKVVLGDGHVLYKLFDGKVFLGVWADDGWHEALTADGWSVKPQGRAPLGRPDEPENQYFTNGGREVTADYFTDDSEQPYVTVVVKSAKEKADLLKVIPSAAMKGVRLNVFLSDWWAAKRNKSALTVQDANGKVTLKGDATDTASVLAAIKFALTGPTPVAPVPHEPKSEPEPKPVSPSPSPLPPQPVTIPLGAFWGTVVTLSLLGVNYVRSR